VGGKKPGKALVVGSFGPRKKKQARRGSKALCPANDSKKRGPLRADLEKNARLILCRKKNLKEECRKRRTWAGPKKEREQEASPNDSSCCERYRCWGIQGGKQEEAHLGKPRAVSHGKKKIKIQSRHVPKPASTFGQKEISIPFYRSEEGKKGGEFERRPMETLGTFVREGGPASPGNQLRSGGGEGGESQKGGQAGEKFLRRDGKMKRPKGYSAGQVSGRPPRKRKRRSP